MIDLKARFDKSSQVLRQCPDTNLPEYAFIGRSNVGKSSLINMICNRKGLAKTSSKPGKTRLVNHFAISNNENEDLWYLVDLPGYGYASVSKKERAKWSVLIDEYILGRKNLINLFVLIDSRHEPQKLDIDFLIWLGENQIPFSIVFTKVDKLNMKDRTKNRKRYDQYLAKYWEPLPERFYTSSEKKWGREEILERIQQINASL